MAWRLRSILPTPDSSSVAYWNDFYAASDTKKTLDLPSQFAVFFIGEVAPGTDIVDFGCGTGRDSLFFASRGNRVIGVDGSKSAVELCQSRAGAFGYENARFVCGDLGDPATFEQLRGGQGAALYARFFIHAITDEAEETFLRGASGLVQDSILAVEFRTARDAQQAKVTPTHFRRFVNPLDFVSRASAIGFEPTYFTEGFGFAKYKLDDAHVARLILRKTR